MGLRVVSVPVCLPACPPAFRLRSSDEVAWASGRKKRRKGSDAPVQGGPDGRPDVNLVDNGNPSIGDGQDMQSC